jgi:hypothetical protein
MDTGQGRSVKTMLGLGLLLPGLLLAASFGASADTAWGAQERQVTLQSAADGFGLVSTNPGSDDQIVAEFDARSASFSLQFTDPDDAVDLHLETSFASLIEFRDEDDDGRYGPGDVVVRNVDFTELDGTVVPTPLSGGGHAVVVSYDIPAPPADAALPSIQEAGSFRLLFTMVPEPRMVAGAQMQPTEVAFAVEAMDFPFAEEDTLLAMETVATVPAGDSLSIVPGGLATGRDSFDVAFGLRPGVERNGFDSDAPQAWSATGDQIATVVTTWPHSDSLRHEGGYTVERASEGGFAQLIRSPPGEPWLYLAGLATVLVGLGIPTIRRLRGT